MESVTHLSRWSQGWSGLFLSFWFSKLYLWFSFVAWIWFLILFDFIVVFYTTRAGYTAWTAPTGFAVHRAVQINNSRASAGPARPGPARSASFRYKSPPPSPVRFASQFTVSLPSSSARRRLRLRLHLFLDLIPAEPCRTISWTTSRAWASALPTAPGSPVPFLPPHPPSPPPSTSLVSPETPSPTRSAGLALRPEAGTPSPCRIWGSCGGSEAGTSAACT